MYSYPRGTLSPLRTHHCCCYRLNTCSAIPLSHCASIYNTTSDFDSPTPIHLQPNDPAIATTCCYYSRAIAVATTTPNISQQLSPPPRTSIYMTTLALDTVSPYPNINTYNTATMKKSPLTPSTITPPSINRQHSYNSTSTAATRPSLSPFSLRSASTDARNILSQVAHRAASHRRSNTTPSGSPLNTPAPESPTSTMERRRSWEDCVHQRDGYISFPDFDEINADASGR